jgi:hypothetical protein
MSKDTATGGRCGTCNGRGYTMQFDADGGGVEKEHCNSCDGTGRVQDRPTRFYAGFSVIDGVARLDSNGHVPFDDKLAEFESAGHITPEERTRSNEARQREAVIAGMRAAFGPGTEVVNIITGKRTKL